MQRKRQVKIKSGDIYGFIKILSPDTASEKKSKIWVCECLKCGKTFKHSGHEIFRLQNIGCPECTQKARLVQREENAKKYIGMNYGFLHVIDFAGIKNCYGRNTPIMICQCNKCGNLVEIPLNRLKSGQVKACKECGKKHLEMGREISKIAAIDGTSVIGIDGRRQRNKNNTSGCTGVSWNTRLKKWRAYINFKRKQYHLGNYNDLDTAIQARKEAEKVIYGNFLEWYAKKYPEQWKKIEGTNSHK